MWSESHCPHTRFSHLSRDLQSYGNCEFYDALQLRGIPTALLRAPGTDHGDLRSMPSQSTAIIAAALAWIHKYDLSQIECTPPDLADQR